MKYEKAIGIGSAHTVKTNLSLGGAAEWAVSKSPAFVGGLIASEVYDVGQALMPSWKYSRNLLGSLFVGVVAFAMQAMLTTPKSGLSHVADKITDGMVGRISGTAMGLIKGALGWQTANASPGEQLSIDGDRQAMRDFGELLEASPQTQRQLVDILWGYMKDGGIECDDQAKAQLIDSLDKTTKKLKNGDF